MSDAISMYRYHIYYPASYAADADRRWPLLLFLHGAGEKGDDLEQVKRQGLPKYLQDKPDFPFVVAWPQCPRHAFWQEARLHAWLQEVLRQVRADTSRIYLTGISMGGFGTWNWATAHPETFAAILPICGGGDPLKADRLAHVPIWAFHGAKDDIVPLEETLEMVEAVKDADGSPRLTVYPDLKHDSWTQTYQNPEIYDWLLQHQKAR